MQKILRQGDVGLIPLDGPPTLAEGGKLKKENKKLIRRGENGGVHELADLKQATIHVEERMVDGTTALFGRYIKVEEETQVVHKEHNPITLVPGWYEIRIQREFFGNAVRFTGD